MSKQGTVYCLKQLTSFQHRTPTMKRFISVLRQPVITRIVLRDTTRWRGPLFYTFSGRRYEFARLLTTPSPRSTDDTKPPNTNANNSTSESGFPLVQPSKIVNQNKDLNLYIDERAAWRLDQIFKESKEVMRITVESGGCHGFQYNLELVPGQRLNVETGILHEPIDKDGRGTSTEKEPVEDEFDTESGPTRYIIYMLPNNGGRVIIDEKSLKILNNSVLTYTKELIGSSFKIMNQKLKSRCGCGTSFDIDI